MTETEEQGTAAAAPLPDIKREISRIRERCPQAIQKVVEQPERGMFWITVSARQLPAVAQALRDDAGLAYDLLCDVTCVDRPEERQRFHVLYNLYSISRRMRLFLRVCVADGEAVPTLTPVYAGADWAEREVADLFGVVFEGHPDPRPILLPDGFEGHPLRKDFPLVGRRPVLLYNNVKDIL